MEDERKNGEPEESSESSQPQPGENRDLQSTAELISNIDEAVAEYSFSIDDILAEFGVKREEEPQSAEPDKTDTPPDEQAQSDKDEIDELTERLGAVADEMREEQEEQRLREIERHVRDAAENIGADDFPASPDQIDEEGQVHIFEETPEPEEKKRRFLRRKKEEQKTAPDAEKLFGGSLDDVFGADASARPARGGGDTSEEEFERELESEKEHRRRKKKKALSEEELEREVFGEDGEKAENREPPAPEVSPDEEAKTIVERLGRSRLRLLGGAIAAVLLIFILVAPHVGIPLPAFLTYMKEPYIYLFICCALELAAMALCFEITAKGIRDLIKLRPNMESVVVFANIASLLHMIMVMIKPEWEGYFGYSAVATASLVLSEYYARKLELAKLKSCRAASGMTRPYVVCAEPDIYDGETALVKYRADAPLGFVARLNADDRARRVWRIAAPIVILGSIALAAAASFGSGAGHRFFWCLAAISAAGAPLGIMLPYCLCFSKAARHLYSMGEALAGYSAAEALGSAESIVVTDGDIFPPGNISLSGLKVYGGNGVDRVLCYAASLISASGAATARPFVEHLREQSGELMKVSALKFYENGGIGGEIEGHTVLAGSASFMMRNGIRIPQDAGGKTTLIFVAINLEIAGVFALSYTASPAVRSGLSMLMRQQITPVFATRDFNISPAMIEARFKLSTDTVDFPKEAERLALSDPDRMFFAKSSAVISREGLKHYAECVVCARNLRRAVRLTTGITLASAVLAMLVMFFLCFTGAVSVATPLNLLIYAALWLLPNLIAARWVVA